MTGKELARAVGLGSVDNLQATDPLYIPVGQERVLFVDADTATRRRAARQLWDEAARLVSDAICCETR